MIDRRVPLGYEVGARVETTACPQCGGDNRVPATAIEPPCCTACRQALPWLTAAGDRDFPAVVTESDLPVLVDLWTPSCGPCRIVAPGVQRAAHGLAGRLKAVKVNVDEAPAVVQLLGAWSVPTLVVLHHGRERARQVGAAAPDAVLRWVEAAIRA